ncbi:hypothetical protein [Acetobacter orientalis]|uniref:hypothetical protein n=1 Tax=Acetobacter orientalis TaxID=146474 RepID=UPI0039EC2349
MTWSGIAEGRRRRPRPRARRGCLTPVGRYRDKREYLRVAHGGTGGVQRFRAGLHGAAHEEGAMIAYIQAGDVSTLTARIDHDRSLKLAVLRSNHERAASLVPITLTHLWIEF